MVTQSQDHVLPIQLQELFDPPLYTYSAVNQVNTATFSDTITKDISTEIIGCSANNRVYGGYIRLYNWTTLALTDIRFISGVIKVPFLTMADYINYFLNQEMGYLPRLVLYDSVNCQAVFVLPQGWHSYLNSSWYIQPLDGEDIDCEAKLIYGAEVT